MFQQPRHEGNSDADYNLAFDLEESLESIYMDPDQVVGGDLRAQLKEAFPSKSPFGIKIIIYSLTVIIKDYQALAHPNGIYLPSIGLS
jgi:hypothetical protein